jgi:hypothetical protein
VQRKVVSQNAVRLRRARRPQPEAFRSCSSSGELLEPVQPLAERAAGRADLERGVLVEMMLRAGCPVAVDEGKSLADEFALERVVEAGRRHGEVEGVQLELEWELWARHGVSRAGERAWPEREFGRRGGGCGLAHSGEDLARLLWRVQA